jgi:hypothetical protein
VKHHYIGVLQFLVSGGIFFPIGFGLVAIGHAFGVHAADLPKWILVGGYVVCGATMYILTHLMPTKVSNILGVCGWLTIPVAVAIKVL